MYLDKALTTADKGLFLPKRLLYLYLQKVGNYIISCIGIFLCDFLENKSPKRDKKYAEGRKFQARGPHQGSEGLKFSARSILFIAI